MRGRITWDTCVNHLIRSCPWRIRKLRCDRHLEQPVAMVPPRVMAKDGMGGGGWPDRSSGVRPPSVNGAPHIHGELLKLGFVVAQSTVGKTLQTGPRPDLSLTFRMQGRSRKLNQLPYSRTCRGPRNRQPGCHRRAQDSSGPIFLAARSREYRATTALHRCHGAP